MKYPWVQSERVGCSRRELLLGATGFAAAMSPIGIAAGAGIYDAPAALATMPGLKDHASAKGILFGTAIAPTKNNLSLSDPAYGSALVTECNVFVAENAMKWGSLEATRGALTFGGADAVATFAERSGAKLRGHTLLWHQNVPGWVEPALGSGGAEAVIRKHIAEIVGRYKGRVHSWDVVNEGVGDAPVARTDGLRTTPFLNALGPTYFDIAFDAAHQADPDAVLTYNDYNLEHGAPHNATKRNNVLRLLEGLRKRNVPVQALGVQAHLHTGEMFVERDYARFLNDIAQLGLKIFVTELDVDDRGAPMDLSARDAQCGDLVRAFLDVTLAQKACTAVLTWGIADKISWLNLPPHPLRSDGATHRPAVLDDDLKRKPMWQAIARSFLAAPAR